MNAAQVHLTLNHIPVLGVIGGFLLLLLARWRKSSEIEMAALLVLVIAAVFAVPTYLSGGDAEHVVEDLPGVIEDFIEPHEELALIALIGAIILGVVAAFGLWQMRSRGQIAKAVSTTTLALALVVSGLMAYTAWLGGEVRHVEIRSDFAAPQEGAEGAEEDEASEADTEADPEADPEAGATAASSGGG